MEYHACALKSCSSGSWCPNGAVGSVSAWLKRVWSPCPMPGGVRCVVVVSTRSFVKNGNVYSFSGSRAVRKVCAADTKARQAM